jgi:hypothetical protein
MTTTTESTSSTPVTGPDPSPAELEHLVDTWLAAYAEPDAARRDELVAQVWTADGRLADPPFEGSGRSEISALTDVVLAHFPGHTFRRTSAVDAHHGIARYAWELVGGDGTVAVAGLDVAELAGGRLSRVTGFFGDLAPR